MLQQIQDQLSEFKTISLAEMDSARLLNRFDNKYYFHIDKINHVLSQITKHYKLLEVDGIKLHQYESIYFDTDDFLLFRHHHNGLLNRNKIRFRIYQDTQLSFFEIKHKNNKGKTIKHRLKTTDLSLHRECEDFLIDNAQIKPDLLQMKIRIYYSRLSFVNFNHCERLTLDCQLLCRNNNSQQAFPNLVIAEIKKNNPSQHSPFTDIMQQLKITEGGLSKYCMGISCLYPELKQNLFKEKFIQLKKLIV